jgi:polyhydroxyalkanoate synthase
MIKNNVACTAMASTIASRTGTEEGGKEMGSKEIPASPQPDAPAAQTPPPLPLSSEAGLPPAAAGPTPAAGNGPSPQTPRTAAPEGPANSDQSEAVAPDVEALSRNVARMIEESGKVVAAYLKPREEGRSPQSVFSEEAAEAVKSIGQVAEHWMSDPQRAVRAQTELSTRMLELWGNTFRRMAGEPTAAPSKPDTSDKRFADPEWSSSPIFDFLRQAYSITTDWANRLAVEAEGLDPHTRDKAKFWIRQIASALSPSNFPATNPELLRETLKQNGENLVRGMHFLAEDIAAGKGELRIRQSDTSKFELGVNMATTPGKVIFRNDLHELIQYSPTTETVFKRPLLIVPPWINKYYVLDLNADKSFVRWAVSQGLTVFVISWVNPDERHRHKSFESYMREGVLEALTQIEKATGESVVTAIGYCVGGTLLSVTLAYMAQVRDQRIESATLFATQVDFRDPGDLKVFVDENQVRAIEAQMAESGYLDGAKMANAFNMLRPNDLIWTYVVNNYLKGKAPTAFDLLTWNSDSTRMTEANHSFYLRNCYLNNNLTKGDMVIGNRRLNLKDVTIPIYNLATREDHIAPARSVFTGSLYFGGPVRYVLAGSGHIAGVVNPPSKAKYQYWTGPDKAADLDDWLHRATEHPGTWWTDWLNWIAEQSPERVPARIVGAGALKPLCDAPGTYVKVRY